MSVLVEIPFTYEAEVLHYRTRSTTRTAVTTSTVARIEQLEPDMAPRVASVVLQGNQAFADGSREHVYRRRPGGGLVRPWLGLVDAALPYATMNAVGLDAQFRAQAALGGHNEVFLPPMNIGRWMAEGTEVRQTISSSRRAREAQLRTILGNLVFVGDVLHVGTPGPAWLIVTDYMVSSTRPFVTPALDRPSGKEFYAADRLEQACGDAAAMAAQRAPTQVYNADVRGSIEVDDGPWLQCDADWTSLGICLGNRIARTTKSVGSWPRPLCDAWLDIRDQLERGWPATRDQVLAGQAVLLSERLDFDHTGARYDVSTASLLGRLDYVAPGSGHAIGGPGL